jgi:hypothetical protein
MGKKDEGKLRKMEVPLLASVFPSPGGVTRFKKEEKLTVT